VAAKVEREVGGLVRHREARQAMQDQARAGRPPAGALDLNDGRHHARRNAFARLCRRERLGMTGTTLAGGTEARCALQVAIARSGFARRQRERQTIEGWDAGIGEGRGGMGPGYAIAVSLSTR